MLERQERLASNESLFREVNERVQEKAQQLGGADHVFDYFCECADAQCSEHVALTMAEYEAVRAHARRFLVAPGHERPEIERVVERRERSIVVEKIQAAGEVADDLDPRNGDR